MTLYMSQASSVASVQQRVMDGDTTRTDKKGFIQGIGISWIKRR